jgi:putative methyltransferase (TIGR04325 family)
MLYYKVKEGKAIYERDSILFDKIEYSWPLLSGILLAATVDKGRLSVLDFGGSLGSTYFQNRKFLSFIGDLSWNIMEQPHFVETGRLYFQNEILHFYYDVEECVKKENPNVLILSSVLQYLEKPYDILDKLLSFNFPFIIIDRTPFHYKGYDRITIQRVPRRIYNASYPCWIFDYEKFLNFFRK